MNTFTQFFNSPAFAGITTLVVGFFAIYLYAKQKLDHKRGAASLILQEIRYAEQLLREATPDTNFRLADRLLPTNSWNTNINLFVKELEETEIDLISRFYSRAAYIDKLVGKISDLKNDPSRPGVAAPVPIVIPQTQHITVPTPEMVQPPQQPQVILRMNQLGPTQTLLREVTSQVEYVYNTPTGEKLKALSQRKFLFFI